MSARFIIKVSYRLDINRRYSTKIEQLKPDDYNVMLFSVTLPEYNYVFAIYFL